jgi:hypothetical protein
MAPTLQATLGVKGRRPTAPTRDCKDLLYAFAVVNLLSAAVHSNTPLCPKDAKKQTGKSKTRRLQEAFAVHLRHVGRAYPADRYKEVVLLIDLAPWHADKPIDEALAEDPHLKLKRLPSCSPHLNPIERLWKALRRRATHNRLFDTLADLRRSIRASLCYFQTVRARAHTLLQSKRFRMRYDASRDGKRSGLFALGSLESEDGIRWVRPHRVPAGPPGMRWGASVLDVGPD